MKVLRRDDGKGARLELVELHEELGPDNSVVCR